MWPRKKAPEPEVVVLDWWEARMEGILQRESRARERKAEQRQKERENRSASMNWQRYPIEYD